ncbi:MAG: flap endonuclease [Geodermatophilaceae bacterium]|nr:flap endonuclease [Geodermatophilaceae bacterium]
MDAPLLLAVDGNSLLHRAYHAHEESGQRTLDGQPCWAINGVWSQLLAAVNRVDPAGILVAFDDADVNQRRQSHPAYKAHRAIKHDNLIAQLASAPEQLARSGLCVVTSPGAEADDVLASAAAQAERAGWRCVVATSDRDAFALITAGTSVLRIINGGVTNSPLLTPSRLRILTGIDPEQYCEYAALRGDTSDNLPGVPGIGPKTAVRLLNAYPTVAAAMAAEATELAAVIGRSVAAKLTTPVARQTFAMNLDLMTMRTDLPLPDFDEMRIPIPPGDLLAELEEWCLAGVRDQARWLLTDPATYRTLPKALVAAAAGFEQTTLW